MDVNRYPRARHAPAALVFFPAVDGAPHDSSPYKFLAGWSISALPPKVDIAERERHVRFVPKADMGPVCVALSSLGVVGKGRNARKAPSASFAAGRKARKARRAGRSNP